MSDGVEGRHRDFGGQEYARRAELVREALAREGLDGLILTHEPNIRWLVGYHITLSKGVKWMNTAVVFPREPDRGSALMLARDANGQDLAHVDEVRFWDGGTEPPFDSYAEPAGVLAEAIRRRGLESGRIGMELGAGMRVDLAQNDIAALREALPGITAVDFTAALWRLRSIKSEAEVECLRKAAGITLEGYGHAFAMVKEGMTEKELAAIICSKWLELGAEGIGFMTIVSDWRAFSYTHVGPWDTPIRAGEIVNVDGGCVVKGYCADVFRMVCVGAPRDAEERRLIECIITAKNDAIAAIRPGVRSGEVFSAAERTLREAGFGHVVGDTTIGHGLGLELHELPTLTQGSEVEIRENMVLCVEPWTVDYSDCSMGRNFEDTVRVTLDGTELLTAGLDDLVVV